MLGRRGELESTAHEEKREQSGIAGGLTEEQERKIEKWLHMSCFGCGAAQLQNMSNEILVIC